MIKPTKPELIARVQDRIASKIEKHSINPTSLAEIIVDTIEFSATPNVDASKDTEIYQLGGRSVYEKVYYVEDGQNLENLDISIPEGHTLISCVQTSREVQKESVVRNIQFVLFIEELTPGGGFKTFGMKAVSSENVGAFDITINLIQTELGIDETVQFVSSGGESNTHTIPYDFTYNQNDFTSFQCFLRAGSTVEFTDGGDTMITDEDKSNSNVKITPYTFPDPFIGQEQVYDFRFGHSFYGDVTHSWTTKFVQLFPDTSLTSHESRKNVVIKIQYMETGEISE